MFHYKNRQHLQFNDKYNKNLKLAYIDDEQNYLKLEPKGVTLYGSPTPIVLIGGLFVGLLLLAEYNNKNGLNYKAFSFGN